MKTCWGLFFAMLVHFCAVAGQTAGRVITVVDGNTIEVATTDGDTCKILLYGIDCPELGQEFGDQAKSMLEKLLLNRDVLIEIQGKDRWGNRLGIVSFPGETDPRIELLKRGLAWTAERNPLPELEQVRVEAQENAKGLWKEPAPTPPWIFRRQQTLTQLKSS